MFLSSQRLSDSEVCEKLGENIALEYVRDSPLFRQQLNAFEESCSGISGYARSVLAAIREVDSAVVNLQQAHTRLASTLTGRDGGYSRCLFTNAFPKLGTLTNNLHEAANSFDEINTNLDTYREMLTNDVGGIINELTLTADNEISKKHMEKLHDSFESKLLATLSSRSIVTNEMSHEMCDLRSEFELARFDLVAKLNRENCKKKFILSKTVCQLITTFDTFFKEGCRIVAEKAAVLEPICVSLPDAEADLLAQEMLWGRVRARLQGELVGAMAAPGSPPGALSPIQPRVHQGMPVYSSTLTTEVLANSTRNATFNDVRHATDEGDYEMIRISTVCVVFKQGYLCFKTGLFSTKKRKWHRLYATKLYITEIATGQATCSMDLVCDIQDCSVSVKPGNVPYTFIIGTSDGGRHEFQAESEDEMVLWITAVRRCSVSAPGRHTTAVGRRQYIEELTKESESTGEPVVILPPETTLDGPGKVLLRQFVLANATCAECGASPVTWISTSLGLTLCQPCATIHRQLSWAISKLKSIELDEFSEWQMKILHHELGNERVNAIWEMNIPAGWQKPQSSASPEDRAKWILAKYKWFAFVDEVHLGSERERTQVMLEAVRQGSTERVMYAISLKCSVNCFDQDTGDTPLHVAGKEMKPNVFGFLLLNGADIYIENSDGLRPTETLEGHAKRLMEDMLMQIQKGHY